MSNAEQSAKFKAIGEAAKKRLRDSEEQIDRSVKAIQGNKPMEAEPDKTRLVRRMERVTGAGPRLATTLARGADPLVLGLEGRARASAERIQGRTVDFLLTPFSQLLAAACPSVGRVIFRNGDAQGSGFMISNQLFITNNHVIPSAADARGFLVEFNYELDIFNQETPVTRFNLDPGTFFLTSAEDDLDFSIIAVGGKVSGPGSLEDFGFCPLLEGDDKHSLGENVNIVQHPNGDYKTLVVRENRLLNRRPTVLHYVADTEPGSSGSPVFNDQWQVVALHHWGEPFRDVHTANGRLMNKNVNEGVRISAIITEAQRLAGELAQDQQALLETALDVTSALPSLAAKAAGESRIAVSDAGSTIVSRNGHTAESPMKINSASELTQSHTNGGQMTLTVPLHITIQLGTPESAAAATNGSPVKDDVGSIGALAAAERVTIDQRYSNRNGYDPDFLEGFPIQLPGLSDEQQEVAAVNQQAGRDANPFELKYQNFSILMNGERRMAFYTATNIDGANAVNVDRETGRAEASETWFLDPRIDREQQSDQSLYSNQRPRRLFDRGHLTRRMDPNSGSVRDAERANADTFHFTNCTPQASGFNQSQRFWQGIENYILDNAIEEKVRVTVFTGPVFENDDPDYRYVKVPRKFWKVFIRIEDDRPVVTAVLADQSGMLRSLPEAIRGTRESFSDTERVDEFLTTVQHLEELTGLDFGNLKEFDPSGISRAESRGGAIRKLTRRDAGNLAALVDARRD